MNFLLSLMAWLNETVAGVLVRGTPRTKSPPHSHGIRYSLRNDLRVSVSRAERVVNLDFRYYVMVG